MASLDFYVKLKENLSSMMPKMANAAQTAFGKVNGNIDAADRRFKIAGRSITDLNNRLSLLTQKRDLAIGTSAITAANKEIQELERSIKRMQGLGRETAKEQGKSGGFLQNVAAMGIGGLLTEGVSAAIGEVKSQTAEVLKSGMDASKNRAQFDVLGKGGGAELYKGLTDYIKDSIFGNEQYDLAKEQLSYGVKANEVLGNLKMLGDIAGGDVEKMKLLNYAYAQTTSADKLKGDDLKQYTSSGFNPLEVISEHTGKSLPQLMKEQEAGKISAAMVKQAMVWDTTGNGLHAGMLAKMGETPFGKLDAMKGNVGMAIQGLGEKLMPTFGKLLDSMKPLIDGLPVFMDKLLPYGERFAAMFGEMMPNLLLFGRSMGGLIKPIVDLAMSPEMMGAMKNVLGLATSIGTVLAPVIGMLAEDMKVLANSVKGVTGMISGVIDWAGKNGLTKAVTNAFDNSPVGIGVSAVKKMNHWAGWDAGPMETNGQMKNVAGYKKYSPQDAMAAMKAGKLGKAEVPAKAAAAAAEVSDSIVGGGKKSINFHIRNVVGTINNNPASSGEAVVVTEDNIIGAMARLAAMSAEM